MFVSLLVACAECAVRLASSASAVTRYMRWMASTKRIPTNLMGARQSDTVESRMWGRVLDGHERDLEAICDLCDDWALGEEIEEPFPDTVGQWKHEDAKGHHLDDLCG